MNIFKATLETNNFLNKAKQVMQWRAVVVILRKVSKDPFKCFAPEWVPVALEHVLLKLSTVPFIVDTLKEQVENTVPWNS